MELLSLDTKDVTHPAAAELISTYLEKGRKRFQEHLKGLEMGEDSTLYDPIKKNQVDFFRQIPASILSSKQKVLKQDRELFSRLFVSCQSRKCDLTLLRHPCKKSESVGGAPSAPPSDLGSQESWDNARQGYGRGYSELHCDQFLLT